jgi:tRNA pseudouridine13 synthase
LKFTQTSETFFVEETLLYDPAGEGDYRLARIRKRNMSTNAAKRQISERTGVPLREIDHAGMKDTLATATQWFSWPQRLERQLLTSGEDFEVLETTYNGNSLSVGHVRENRFRLILEDVPSDQSLPEHALKPFPNFYGRQRFGRDLEQPPAMPALQGRKPKAMMVSKWQSYYFNQWLRHRLESQPEFQLTEDEIWTFPNGKRHFTAPLDDDLRDRFSNGVVSPSGPMPGFKIPYREDEQQFLKERFDVEPEKLRAWGKLARGSRRPLFVRATDVTWELLEDSKAAWSFSLPSGAYATVYYNATWQPDFYTKDIAEWPDFTPPQENRD